MGTTAQKLQAILNSKAAIKAAIVAKSPATAPTDVLSQWPTAIASIPTGGCLDDIIAAVEAMDGLDHSESTQAQLASAIVQINRSRKLDSRTPTPSPSPSRRT